MRDFIEDAIELAGDLIILGYLKAQLLYYSILNKFIGE